MTTPLIAHTTDLSGDDGAAFVHACALAAAGAGRLVTIHGNAPASEVNRLPDARELSTRWGRTIDHERRCHECCDDVTDTVLDAIRDLGPELVVAGTHARHGLAGLLHDSVGEALARNVGAPTLVVPNRTAGFVDPSTGAIALRHVLVPAGTPAEARQGVAVARQLLALAGVTDATIEVIHATASGDRFELDEPGVTVSHRPGHLEEVVLATARERGTGLIVMVSRGHDGVLDVLRGSHTEHVIRDAPCPVLTVATA